mgnify:CR=1 FL=1
MAQKPQIIIEYYDPETKIIEGTKVDGNQTAKRFREKGYKVDEFKKLIRKKFGDDVDIVNKIQKHRDMPFVARTDQSPESRTKDDGGVTTRDIIEIMKNKQSD